MYTASDLRNMSAKELHTEKRNLSRDLYLLRVESANGQLKQHHKAGKLKKTIARINGVLTEKKTEAMLKVVKEALDKKTKEATK